MPVWKPAWTAFRRRLRKLWLSRGGGYYGLVTALTFMYLEAVGIASDLRDVGQFSINLGWLISFLVSSFVDAILNGVLSALWPLHWIGRFGVGLELLAFLGGSYVLFRLTKPAILHLLEGDDDELSELAGRNAGAHLEPPLN